MTTGPVVHRQYIADLGTDAACASTIAAMSAIIRQESQYPTVVHAAYEAAANAVDESTRAYVDACYWLTKQRLTFVTDPERFAALFGGNANNVELLQAPSFLLSIPNPQGDCDCFSMLLGALLVANGVPFSLVTIATPESNPGYGHVYGMAHIPRENIALDASHGGYPGWEYPNALRKTEWRVY